jgi:hypothetical protein
LADGTQTVALVLPNPSRQLWLKNVIAHTAGQNWVAKLYTNNYTPLVGTPSGGSVAADFTEAAGGGYVAKTLTGGTWTLGDDGVDDGLASYTEQVWTFTGALTGSATIYGVFFVQATSGLLLAAEKFANPFQPLNNGDAYGYTPKVRLGDLTP